jgi:hypothetical protein
VRLLASLSEKIDMNSSASMRSESSSSITLNTEYTIAFLSTMVATGASGGWLADSPSELPFRAIGRAVGEERCAALI